MGDETAPRAALPPKRNPTIVGILILVALVYTAASLFIGDPSGPLAGWFQWLSMFGAWIVVLIYAGPRWYVRSVEALSEALGRVALYLVVLVVVIGFLNVVLRTSGRWFGAQLVNNRWIESQWYLYGIIFLIAFAYILKHQINVRVDFWFAGWSKQRKAWIDTIGHSVALIPFCILAMWTNWSTMLRSFGRRPDGSWPEGWAVWRTWEQSPDPSGFPRAPIKAMIFVGFTLLLLQAIAEMIKLRAVLTNREAYYGLAEEDREEPLRIE